MKEVIWLVDSKEILKTFPREVQWEVGYALDFVQRGGMPTNVKPLKGLGGGVFEIVENASSGTYRVVYAVQLGEFLYVLHSFQKKSTHGIATPQREIRLIEQRLKLAKMLAKK